MTNEDQIISQALEILESRLQQPGQIMNNPVDVKRFLALKLSQEEREVFAVLFLDVQLQMIEYRELFFGTVDKASVFPREVLKSALNANATALIFAHNHPSQNPEPSHADIALTRELSDLLDRIDVRVIDHIIVAGLKTTSFAERGLL